MTGHLLWHIQHHWKLWNWLIIVVRTTVWQILSVFGMKWPETEIKWTNGWPYTPESIYSDISNTNQNCIWCTPYAYSLHHTTVWQILSMQEWFDRKRKSIEPMAGRKRKLSEPMAGHTFPSPFTLTYPTPLKLTKKSSNWLIIAVRTTVWQILSMYGMKWPEKEIKWTNG